MIIAVTGWRNHADRGFIWSQLNTWRGPFPLHVRVGDARGGDLLVRQWCTLHLDVTCHVFAADWSLYGRLAGSIRNHDMLTGKGDPTVGPTDLLLAFPRTDGVRSTIPGSGTFGCVVEAALLGIRVEIPPYHRTRDTLF